LGLGTYDETKKRSEYKPTIYELNGKRSRETEFVQVAEIEILGRGSFDRIIVVATQKSYDAHFDNLRRQLLGIDVDNDKISYVIITENMEAEAQWEWFEKILAHIESGDGLTIDLTHGYRASSIVLSAAINFLQKAKKVELNAVYYGAYEKDRRLAPIVDMKDFYTINEWAEAVSRLVEDADARKMAEVAETTSDFQVREFNDEEIIAAFEDLTNTIRNVDVNNVADKANSALRMIREKENQASVTGRILLKLVMDKFASLTAEQPLTGKYDKPYFILQLEIIRLLLEHKLFMQAYTVMREFIGSIGMSKVEKAKVSTAEGRGRRRRFAEVFVKMFQFPEGEWCFKGQEEKDRGKLMPYYKELKSAGIETILRRFTKDLTDYRNGFDHAWTMKSQAPSDVEEKGHAILGELKEVVRLLETNEMLG